jgi:hypothetical protein
MTQSTVLLAASPLIDLQARIAQIKILLTRTTNPSERERLIAELCKIAEQLVEIGWDGK